MAASGRLMHFLILGVKWGFGAITLVQDTLEFKQGLYRRGRLSIFHKKVQPKFRPIGLASKAHQSWSKKENTPLCEPVPGEPLTKIKKYLLIKPRRLAASVEGLNNSLAIAAGEYNKKSTRQSIGARGR